MTITELIEALKETKEQFGDKEIGICFYTPDRIYHSPFVGIADDTSMENLCFLLGASDEKTYNELVKNMKNQIAN